jgi:glutamine synthetase adenylyltransferase
MSFETEEITIPKRKHEDIILDDDTFEESMKKDEEDFLQLLQEAAELMKNIPSPVKGSPPKTTVQVKEVEEEQQTKKEIPSSEASENSTPTSILVIPSWKQELQKKFDSVTTIEDLDHLTKELVKKNRPRKLPKKKLVRVENFYQRHISGLEWMNNFLNRTKTDAISRPYVERMLEMEKKFKTMIENDELLGPQLAKDE